MENGPPKWLPDEWTLFMGFGRLSLANWGGIGQKLKRPISLFDQTRWERALTNWCWYVMLYSIVISFDILHYPQVGGSQWSQCSGEPVFQVFAEGSWTSPDWSPQKGTQSWRLPQRYSFQKPHSSHRPW